MSVGRKDKADLSSVMTISAGVDFAGALAEGLLALYHTDDDPLAMSRVTLLLPTRRAVRTMRDAFLRIADGTPLILPHMHPFGDVNDEDMIIGSAADPEGAHGLELPPAISALDRQANLAQLIKAWFEAQGDDPALPLCLDLAAALGRFLDLVAMENADLSALPNLVDDERFASHWQSVMGFLNIVRDAWPGMLAAREAIDAGHKARCPDPRTRRPVGAHAAQGTGVRGRLNRVSSRNSSFVKNHCCTTRRLCHFAGA